jgi:RimJ/RimL family protein N-acetyltransferase
MCVASTRSLTNLLTKTILDTERLTLRLAALGDAAFILRLLNEPSFLRFIGDRKVRTIEDAERYIGERLIASYERNGFGLWVVERRDSLGPIGICGLVKRDALPDADIGFAFLPEFWGHGFAFESAAGVKRYGFDVLTLPRLLAITNPDNVASIRIVEKLGLEFDRALSLTPGEPEVNLYRLER